ncbi:MAG: TIGR01777 family oxidoreductase [Oligoflexia bacterium]|nr:TIGR01777 family oxidoreductase [Oligoflexia bacterium]
MSKRVLLTGATGFIGSELGMALVRSGYEVVSLVRDVKLARLNIPFPTEIVDWKNGEIKDIDYVIHLAGESIAKSRWSEKVKRRLISSRIDSTKKLLEKIKSSKGRKPKAYLAASAIGYYGHRENAWLSEESEKGDGFLSDLCEQWEAENQKAEKLTDRVVLFRIGLVLDRHGGALKEMIPFFKRGLGGQLGFGKQWMSWIHLSDLIQAMIFCLEKEKVSGPVNMVSPNPIQNKEFTKELGAKLKVPTFFTAPKLALRLGLGEMSTLLLSSQKVSSRKLLDAGFKFQYPNFKSVFEGFFSECELKRGCLSQEFYTRQWFPKPIEEVFQFFSEAKNLEEITPPWLKFKILHQSTPRIEEGTTFDYQLNIHGLPVKWRSLILDWEENKQFSDIQQKGPYTLWYHTHVFEKMGSGTLMTDRVLYKLPAGYLGDLFLHWKVRADIEKIFFYRRTSIYSRFWGKD